MTPKLVGITALSLAAIVPLSAQSQSGLLRQVPGLTALARANQAAAPGATAQRVLKTLRQRLDLVALAKDRGERFDVGDLISRNGQVNVRVNSRCAHHLRPPRDLTGLAS